jgi:hypothetical protein
VAAPPLSRGPGEAQRGFRNSRDASGQRIRSGRHGEVHVPIVHSAPFVQLKKLTGLFRVVQLHVDALPVVLRRNYCQKSLTFSKLRVSKFTCCREFTFKEHVDQC